MNQKLHTLIALFVLGFTLIAGRVCAAEPWHLAGWQARAVVDIPRPLADANVDVAGVKILCQGHAKSDGSDYRVLDAAGKPVPFQLAFHDAEHYSLISFRAANPKERYFIYFDNPKAERAAEAVVIDPKPGAGPPKGAWIPRHGLVLQTIQRPRNDKPDTDDNPETVDEMAKLIAKSPYKHGARYQRKIADGYNPFGSSDYYISIYRGWINIPKAGKYQFCTASNEASFSFLDGKDLVHWPGRHTATRGMHGEVNASVELTAGLHYVEYYHEEVTLDQMAFLGWKPEGQAFFGGIPESVYTAPHEGRVTSYETPKGPLLHFEPALVDSTWPTDRHEGQYTRYRFAAGKRPALAADAKYQWDFGDGVTATGSEVEHVFLALGKYRVTLTAQTSQGSLSAAWPLEVFEIENVTEQFREGQPKDYTKLVKSYDRARLDAPNLKELAYLLAETEEPAEAIETAKVCIQRFGAAKPEVALKMRRLMAECSLKLGKEGIDQAITNYQASITAETPPAEKLDVLARLIRLVGIERSLPDKAGDIVAQVEKTWQGARKDADTRAAYRRAVIAAGDVLLWNGKRNGAQTLYQRAEEPALVGQRIPDQVRAARVGAYPNSLRDYIAGGNHNAGLELVERWEETFPTEKLNGQTFFWRGKLLHLRGQDQDAARYLARAVGLGVGSNFESEARWLLAQALEKIGKPAEAKKELAKLIASGITDEFTKKAKESLKKE
jgi:hypothetical protein